MSGVPGDHNQIEGLPIAGYRPQTPAAVETVNAVKEIEEHVLRLLDELKDDVELNADPRWLASGRTQIEIGFMLVNRSVFKPDRVAIPDEDDAIVESGWVLEREDSEPAAPLYYAPGQHRGQWSVVDADALRLARREDAEALADALGVKVRVAEHQWG